jgi:hypothetical protein
MFEKFKNNFQKKSLQERFLLFIGILFFLIYLTFGIIVILWEQFPIRLQPSYRIALGILLIIYGFFRFYRTFNTNRDDE